jgi:membrane protease YdiL (CAAX protease family)
LATALTAAVWYLARSDLIGLRRGDAGWVLITAPPYTATIAFTLTFIALGVVPFALARPVLHRSPVSLGVRLGDPREIIRILSFGVPIALAAGWIGAQSPEVAAVYPLGGRLAPDAGAFAVHAGAYLLYYLGFEYLFRGFLLFGTQDELGALGANLLQACLATAFHFGKPGTEMLAAFPASLAFGWAALRTRSIWCPLAAHWVVGVSMDWFLVFGA